MPQNLGFDQWFHVAELLTFVIAVVKGGLGVRDAIRDLKSATANIRGDVDDHEDRLRVMEGKPMRRRHDAANVLGV